MAVTIIAIWLAAPARKMLRLTTTARWILFGVLLLAIPLLYTVPQWREIAFARWLALAGGAIFYLSLLQYSPLNRCLPWLLYGILVAALFQAGIALLQLTAPELVPKWFAYPRLNGRPYGVFQQVNVLASFIATGLALALVLSLLPGFSLSSHKVERIRQCALALALLVFPALLVWLQSRIGCLGGAISGVLLLLLGWRIAPARAAIVTSLIMLSIAFALLFPFISGLGHEDSNHARLTMLTTTLEMIAAKPWLGWGYGGFEYSFQHFRLAQGFSTLGLGVVKHPHNELLLWWAEGGIIALIGMLILICAGVRVVWLVCRPVRQHTSQHRIFLARGLTCALLPIILHTQTEYLFTLSAAHWAIFLLLLAMVDRLTSKAPDRRSLSASSTAFWGGVIPVLSTAFLPFAVCGLYANLVLTMAERNHLADIEPARAAMKYDLWISTERWGYIQQTHALLTFNQTRDPALLDDYVIWAQHYLSRRIDKNVYASWLAIAQYHQDALTHRRLLEEAHNLFPTDPRFFTPFISQAGS